MPEEQASIPPFFNKKDFSDLAKYAGVQKKNDQPDHQILYDRLKNTYAKTKHWANEIKNQLFPNGRVDVRLIAINQAQYFTNYHWAKIYPDQLTASKKQLALTVGISLPDKLFIKIDTVGYADRDPLRIRYLQYRGNYDDSKIVRQITLNEASHWTWAQLVEITISEIKKLVPYYNELLAQFSNNEDVESNSMSENDESLPVKNENMIDLNSIFYGPPGTGKTFKIQQLAKDFIVSKSSKTRNETLNELIPHLTWWQTVAASLTQLKSASVPELENHEFLKIKASQSGATSIKQIIWGALQSHTDPRHQNVQTTNRIEPFIFEKKNDSIWILDKNSAENQVPEVSSFLNSINSSAGEQQLVHKNYVMVTFHQSYSYEDFVEGIKPGVEEDDDASLKYHIAKGIFYRCCNEAARLAGYENLQSCLDDSKESRRTKLLSAPPFALFIDEINRANVSAVLGELISLIEADKRLGAENEIVDIILPYSKAKFGIPSNLYIIGTMNTADRSVEALDTAMRRRFTFYEMPPVPNLLNNELEGIDLPLMLQRINKRLEVLLSKDHTIGHAWLLGVKSLSDLKVVFKTRIYPLLSEYFYNDYGKALLVLGERFVKYQKIDTSLFPNFRDPDGIRAEYDEKKIYSYVDPSTLSAEDFINIYQ